MLLEYTVLGPQMRVAAIDVATGVEVTLVVPANTPQAHATNLARRELAMRLNRPAAKEPAPPDGRGRYA